MNWNPPNSYYEPPEPKPCCSLAEDWEPSDLCKCGHWTRHHTVGKHNGCGHCDCRGFDDAAEHDPVACLAEQAEAAAEARADRDREYEMDAAEERWERRYVQ